MQHRAGAIDKHIGARIHRRRVVLGLTQQQLATAIGVTYQQEHKYEKGINRISVGRLFEIARALGVAVPWFFAQLGRDQPVLTEDQLRLAAFMAAVAKIRNRGHQRALCDLARALAT